jgi:hypothetical protein
LAVTRRIAWCSAALTESDYIYGFEHGIDVRVEAGSLLTGKAINRESDDLLQTYRNVYIDLRGAGRMLESVRLFKAKPIVMVVGGSENHAQTVAGIVKMRGQELWAQNQPLVLSLQQPTGDVQAAVLLCLQYLLPTDGDKFRVCAALPTLDSLSAVDSLQTMLLYASAGVYHHVPFAVHDVLYVLHNCEYVAVPRVKCGEALVARRSVMKELVDVVEGWDVNHVMGSLYVNRVMAGSMMDARIYGYAPSGERMTFSSRLARVKSSVTTVAHKRKLRIRQ